MKKGIRKDFLCRGVVGFFSRSINLSMELLVFIECLGELKENGLIGEERSFGYKLFFCEFLG